MYSQFSEYSQAGLSQEEIMDYLTPTDFDNGMYRKKPFIYESYYCKD